MVLIHQRGGVYVGLTTTSSTKKDKKKLLVLRVNNARKGPGFSNDTIFKYQMKTVRNSAYRSGVHNK